MGKKSWWSWPFNDPFKNNKSNDASIITQPVVDPSKQAVANPLSSYLASQIGQGLPRYDGVLTQPEDPNFTNRYNEFIGMDAGSYYDKNIAEPATNAFKRDFLPIIDEGYAGGLRGSGRFGGREDAINRFSEGLASQKAQFVPQFAGQQLDQGKSVWAMRDIAKQREYNDWWKSLPQNNPAINQALSFLNQGTSSGTDILSGLDPGQKGWFSDLLTSGALLTALLI